MSTNQLYLPPLELCVDPLPFPYEGMSQFNFNHGTIGKEIQSFITFKETLDRLYQNTLVQSHIILEG